MGQVRKPYLGRCVEEEENITFPGPKVELVEPIDNNASHLLLILSRK
jgi:hypothetical protein